MVTQRYTRTTQQHIKRFFVQHHGDEIASISDVCAYQ